MKLISYAQNGEDVLLDRLFTGGPPGFYIDVGANDPVQHSVTKHFYDQGWRGINIEPAPGSFARLQAERPRDVNLHLGVSDQESTLVFYDTPSASGWATFSPAQAENLRAQGFQVIERRVPVSTLAQVCERHVDGPIDFLKIDAESHEREVLAGADFTNWRPRAVLIEANGVALWEPGLLAADYLFACFDGVNRFYLRAEDRDLLPRLAVPVNALDDFAPYHYLREIEALRARLADYETLGPTALSVARRLRDLSTRFPGLASSVKRIARMAG